MAFVSRITRGSGRPARPLEQRRTSGGERGVRKDLPTAAQLPLSPPLPSCSQEISLAERRAAGDNLNIHFGDEDRGSFLREEDRKTRNPPLVLRCSSGRFPTGLG